MALPQEINKIIWRYMNENGFQHSAFIFKKESMLDSFDSTDSQIPSNTLITLLQKALLFNRLEKIIKEAKSNPEHPLHKSINEIEEMFADDAHIFSSNYNPHIRSFLKLDASNSLILHGHKKIVYACDWSSDGKSLASGSEDGSIIIWYLGDGKYTGNQIIQTSNQNPEEHGISSIDWSSNSDLFAAGSFDYFVRIYKGSGTLIGEFREHTKSVFNIKFNPAGTYLVSWSADKTTVLWNVNTLSVEHVFNSEEAILDIAWKDNTTFAAGSGDRTVGICSVKGDHFLLGGHTNHVSVVAWNCDSSLLASGSEDNTIRIWVTPQFTTITVLQYHQSGITCLKWSPVYSNLVISSSHDGFVYMCDAISGELIREIYHHLGNVISLSMTSNGKFLVSGGNSGLIVVSDLETGNLVASFQGSSPLFDIKWDPSGNYVAACFEDSNVAVIPLMSYLQ
ncbi:F-box-like/WD repeat-containing protein TBL1XR1 [Histomonas meleagridis]|uniref:F-box-like/WD repeat-containing protein TBL1XR1 n=1 Tax=Histomonas meleagridis TaxID=135588 RepID=UPI00355A3876|nr:F-box-like/WD repeat-containing protein TBL1XR1 [Histomonas meleagridis]KAH0798165.1 F-box-like/WD repeat-containing protein TBL1XR1 [Histomonas meleagridis]